MKLMDLLEENVNKPRIVYYNTPDGFKDTPEDQKMIKKMINVYRALSKGRGLVQVHHGGDYPPLDVSYELPPLNTIVILIDYPTRKQLKNGDDVKYIFDVVGKVKYTLHNFETQRDTDMDRFMMHKGYEISFVYKKRFEDFDIAISS